MKNDFHFVLSNYKSLLDGNVTNEDAERVRHLLAYTIPDKIKSLLSLDNTKYKVQGSYGMGALTHTPWIAIFDKDITSSAQRGFYIVILFKGDFSGLYVSLNQGTTYILDKFRGHKPRTKMHDVARLLRSRIEAPFSSDSLETIDLVSSTSRASNYSAANIWAKYYSLNNLPTNNELANDLLTLHHSIEYIKKSMGIKDLDTFINDLIFNEGIEEIKFLEEVQLSIPTTTTRTPQQLPLIGKNKISEAYFRNPQKAKEAIVVAEYTCEANPSHITFISSVTNNNFVEAHHLIPMNRQKEFQYSIDEPGNIVSLCPNCHREIHHATSMNKKRLLKSLYDKKKDDLLAFGIDISFSDLLKMYDLS